MKLILEVYEMFTYPSREWRVRIVSISCDTQAVSLLYLKTIYIYIYICVCVCEVEFSVEVGLVCFLPIPFSSLNSPCIVTDKVQTKICA